MLLLSGDNPSRRRDVTKDEEEKPAAERLAHDDCICDTTGITFSRDEVGTNEAVCSVCGGTDWAGI